MLEISLINTARSSGKEKDKGIVEASWL